MIDLDEPVLEIQDQPFSLFHLASSHDAATSAYIALRAVAGDPTDGVHKVKDLEALRFQLGVISSPYFQRASITWKRFGSTEILSLNDFLIQSDVGTGSPEYVEEILIPTLLQDGEADNQDHSGPDTWQHYSAWKSVLAKQADLFGIGGPSTASPIFERGVLSPSPGGDCLPQEMKDHLAQTVINLWHDSYIALPMDQPVSLVDLGHDIVTSISSELADHWGRLERERIVELIEEKRLAGGPSGSGERGQGWDEAIEKILADVTADTPTKISEPEKE